MTLSTIPPRPPSSRPTFSSGEAALMIEGWVLLRRPDALTPEDFSQALSDLEDAGMLARRIINGKST